VNNEGIRSNILSELLNIGGFCFKKFGGFGVGFGDRFCLFKGFGF
jgi:hypothetical protein